MQIDAVREAVREVAPLMVELVAPAKPEQPPTQPAPPPTAIRPPRPIAEAPLIAAPQATAVPATPFTTPAPPPEPATLVVAAPAPPAPPSPPSPPAAPVAPKLVPASAVSYLVLPPVEVPRLSRRAGEQGTVWLHVLVDSRGLPQQISVRTSSGFARLDDQAVQAMRQARFKPHAENGVAVAIQVITPIEYSLDN